MKLLSYVENALAHVAPVSAHEGDATAVRDKALVLLAGDDVTAGPPAPQAPATGSTGPAPPAPAPHADHLLSSKLHD